MPIIVLYSQPLLLHSLSVEIEEQSAVVSGMQEDPCSSWHPDNASHEYWSREEQALSKEGVQMSRALEFIGQLPCTSNEGTGLNEADWVFDDDFDMDAEADCVADSEWVFDDDFDMDAEADCVADSEGVRPEADGDAADDADGEAD